MKMKKCLLIDVTVNLILVALAVFVGFIVGFITGASAVLWTINDVGKAFHVDRLARRPNGVSDISPCQKQQQREQQQS